MQNVLESMMLLCFGFSWPISVVNNYRSRTARGMSLPFILLIIFGYICGITAKLISHNITYVLAVYIFNLLAVSTNLLVYFRNKKLDNARNATSPKSCLLYTSVLGTGEEKYEWFPSGLQYRFPQQVAAHLVFDADLADLAYAAADLYLMPSKAEPCGLSQLIAMRYGTVPVVNATGGLRDTVTPYDPTTGAGRGFTFQSYNADDFLASIDRALALYYDCLLYTSRCV